MLLTEQYAALLYICCDLLPGSDSIVRHRAGGSHVVRAPNGVLELPCI